MAMLKCDICGGKLMAKSGGLFECEYCGMQYDKTRIQEMVQEIKGTVKVEGTVEVKGTVSVDTKANKENLLKRITICAGDKDFEKIKELVEQVLTLDPECSEAYLWRLMATRRVQNLDALFAGKPIELKITESNADWKKALQFSNSENRQILERRLADAKDYWQKSSPGLKLQFDRIQPVQNLLFGLSGGIIALKADGTVLVTHNERCSWLAETVTWTGVKKMIVDYLLDYVIGIRWDGTMLLAAKNKEKRQTELGNILKCTDIKDIVKSNDWFVALTESGKLISTKSGKEEGTFGPRYYQCSALDWTDVKSITLVNCEIKLGSTIQCYIVLGLTREGKVRCATGPIPEGFADLTWWESHENVVKIGANGDLLLADGSIQRRRNRKPESGKWLDFGLDDKGVCDCLHQNFGRDVIAHDASCALCADGSVICRPTPFGDRVNGEVEQWEDIVAIRQCHVGGNKAALLGLREDGTVLLAWPEGEEREYCVDGWKLFRSLDTFEAERETARKLCLEEAERQRIARQEAEKERILKQRIQRLTQEQQALEKELSNLKGLFTGKRRKEIEARLLAIEAERKGLK